MGKGINIQNKGSGNQCILKIKSSIDKCAENIDIILIEEPENHLSDMNMKKMLVDIINNKSKQTKEKEMTAIKRNEVRDHPGPVAKTPSSQCMEPG